MTAKTKAETTHKEQFFAFMDGMNDAYEDLSDGAYTLAMQDAITGENGWNEQNDDDLDGYEGFMFWVKETWRSQNV